MIPFYSTSVVVSAGANAPTESVSGAYRYIGGASGLRWKRGLRFARADAGLAASGCSFPAQSTTSRLVINPQCSSKSTGLTSIAAASRRTLSALMSRPVSRCS